MRKLIFLLAAGSAMLTSCLKDEYEPSKFEPVQPGLIIYQLAGNQNLLALQSTEIGVRMGMLLAEAKKQGKLNSLSEVSVPDFGNVQANLLGVHPHTDIKKTTDGYDITFNHSRGYKDYYLHKGVYRIFTNGADQLSDATEENPWVVTFQSPDAFVQMVYDGQESDPIYYEGGLTTIYNTGNNTYRIELDNIRCYIQKDLKADWSGDFSWRPGGNDITISSNINKQSRFSGEGSGESLYTLNNRNSASLYYSLEDGIMKGYRQLMGGTEYCRLMSTMDYDINAFPSPLVTVTWSNEGKAYTVKYNGHQVSSN